MDVLDYRGFTVHICMHIYIYIYIYNVGLRENNNMLLILYVSLKCIMHHIYKLQKRYVAYLLGFYVLATSMVIPVAVVEAVEHWPRVREIVGSNPDRGVQQ